MPNISAVAIRDYPQIADLYRECGYRGGIAAADTAIAAMVGNKIVGAVRLCPEGGVTVLRGMQVLPAYQRQGLGSKLLQACVPLLSSGPTYCLPYSHLALFYGKVGFLTAGPATLPQFLQERQSSYVASGIGTIAMSRMAPNNSFKPNPLRSSKTSSGFSGGSA
jgi:GNAT superfamily N-acetyltransferase